MPSPKCREDFLRCQMCKHCYEHRCRDLSGQWISLCKKHHWPTYDPACPDWEEKEEDNWAKREFERRKREKEKEAASTVGGGNEET